MQLAISYYSTMYSKLKEHWQKNSIMKHKGILGTHIPIGKTVELGGVFQRMDWKTKKILDSTELPRPSGFDIKDGQFFVGSVRDNNIIILNDSLKIVGKLEHPHLSEIHSIHFTTRGLLVASTGVDLIIEMDLKGKTIWEWWAFDHGYENDQLGNKRIIDKSEYHCKRDYPTLLETAHPNSAIYTDQNETSLFVTLFHQGQIIEIDCQSLEHKVVVDHLKNPHALYRLEDGGYLASDTNNNRALTFNRQGEIKFLTGDFRWVQDTIRTSKGTYLIADSYNNRIVEIDENSKVLDKFEYSPERKIYQIMELPP